jgi:hypothetical protein
VAWNLVDLLSLPGRRRVFYPPIASPPPGFGEVSSFDRNLFDIAETYQDLPGPDFRTADVALEIGVNPPPGGFTDENSLPHPAIRLHAMDRGRLSFRPQDGSMSDRLVLELFTLTTQTPNVQWWGRWEEAGCVPHKVIYENIDKFQLRAVLGAITPGSSTYGLHFPTKVKNAATKAQFIEAFLQGGSEFLAVEAGAYLGTIATEHPNDFPTPNTPRRLRLHVRYHDHTEANPHPMNPRELFHLLFGDDSVEAQTHPLLRRIHEIGREQTNIHPEARRMLLRPPLRTWKRVEWEADQEITQHQNVWKPDGSLSAQRFYNDRHPRRGKLQQFRNSFSFKGANKCNLFAFDICLRAGFRVAVHQLSSETWGYIDSNSGANLAQPADGQVSQRGVPLMGRSEDKTVIWGFKTDDWLNTTSVSNVDWQQLLNQAMTVEGRCFVVTGARGRKNASRTRGIGHIVIAKQILAFPKLKMKNELNRQILQIAEIALLTMEASGKGAVNLQRGGAGTTEKPLKLGGKGGNAASSNGFIRLHIIELHPGKDPDTRQGLRDLNVHTGNRNLLGTPDENPPA